MHNPANLGEYVIWMYVQLCAKCHDVQPKIEGVTSELVCSMVGGPVAMCCEAEVCNSNVKLIPELCVSC